MNIIKNNINDILDYVGNNNNFLNNKPYSDEYKRLSKYWNKLPLYENKKSIEKFFDLLHNKQVILLTSGTGSGKTVLVPKFFLKYIYVMNISKKIAITNPKILTTQNNAEYGAKTLDVKIGEEVGYKYKGAPKNSYSNESKLLYVTDGLILAIISGEDRLLSEYAGIIIDEAHERSIQIDMLLKLLKDIILERDDFKLIIMSATINQEIFRNYFNIDNIKYGEIEISGQPNFPIEQNWLDPSIKINKSNYLDIAIDKCYEILKISDVGDIIIFVATQNDTINGCKILIENCPKKLQLVKSKCNKLFCIEVFAKMNKNNRELATEKDLYKQDKFDRKVIFTTNVAESSITFDGLVYVIETGFELSNSFDAIENSYVISKSYTTKAQIKQRIGRTGRTQPGISYHLYTKEKYDNLKDYPDPNIYVIDLTDYIIMMLGSSKTVRNILIKIKDLISIPTIHQIVNALYKLSFYKCIKLINPRNNYDDEENNGITLNFSDIPWLKIKSIDNINDLFNGALTNFGINILKFRSSQIITAIAIILAKYMKCQKEMIIIMGIIDITDGKIESLFNYKKNNIKNVKKYFEKYGYNNSDHITIYKIYKNLFKKKKDTYLNKNEFIKINERIRQLNHYVRTIDDKTYQYMNERYKLIIKKPYKNLKNNIYYVLCISHYLNLLKHQGKNIYTSINFLINTTAEIEYCEFTKKNGYNKYSICNNLANTFGNKHFKCITQIPDKIITDLRNEYLINNIF